MALYRFLKPLAATVLLSLPGPITTAGVSLEVGHPFPEIALPSLAEGSPTTVSHWHGRRLMLHVFASW